ncbi:hypothetical protein HNR63_000660 [Anoxybacillus kamchatkensis]|uniref:hypothetical protein n=1 Tax=Anoxybacillus ayderensis TaxID=265546 RepID=UPI0015EB8AD5|nr:hypothetical protein [Anoxybacillus ayderensis]
MYNIFFSKHFLAKHRHMQQLCDALANISEGTELHVHTNKETYYNAQFVQLDTAAKTLTVVVDPFYENGGKFMTIRCRDVVAVEFPADALVAATQQQKTTIGMTKTDDEDE